MGRIASIVSIALVTALACSSSDGGDGGDGDNSAADAGTDESGVGFQVKTPPILIEAGQEITYCYYTTIELDTDVGVRKWSSVMTEGSHHMIMYFTKTAAQPDGTIDTDCGFDNASSSNLPLWTYSAQTPEAEFPMPEGVGMAVKAGQPVQIQMHYLNASDQDLMAEVTIDAETYAPGVEFQQAHPYVTYSTEIDVEPGQSGSVEGTCGVNPSLTFFALSTHSHQFSTKTEVFDGDDLVVESEDWEHPDVKTWYDTGYNFTGSMRYRCEYFNYSDQPLETGDSALTDEMCMAVGYYYPGTKPIICLDSLVLPF